MIKLNNLSTSNLSISNQPVIQLYKKYIRIDKIKIFAILLSFFLFLLMAQISNLFVNYNWTTQFVQYVFDLLKCTGSQV